VIAAPERDVHRPRDEAIGCKGSLAGQQPRILDAFDARSDVLWLQPKSRHPRLRPYGRDCGALAAINWSRRTWQVPALIPELEPTSAPVALQRHAEMIRPDLQAEFL